MKKLTRKSVAILLIMVILSSLLPNLISRAAEPTFSMNISGTSETTKEISVGDVVSVDLNMISGLENKKYFTIVVGFDPNVLEPIPDYTEDGSMMWEDSLSDEIINGRNLLLSGSYTPGGSPEIAIAYAALSNGMTLNTSGALGTLSFKVIGEGSAEITINNLVYSEGNSDSEDEMYSSGSKVVLKGKVPMTGLTLSQNSAIINKGSILTLVATKNPGNTSDTTPVVWESSNKDIATVVDGKVNAVGVGKATITAKCGAFSATCDVEIINPMTGLKVTPESASVNKGKTVTLTASKTPIDTTDSSEITWSSSDENIATVENGVVTALANGTVTITASCGTFSAQSTITVENILSGLIINKESAILEKNNTLELTVTKDPIDTSNTDPIAWRSSNEAVAKVDENGIVTAIGNGKATITASCGGFEVNCEVTVIVHIESINITNGDITLYKGQTEELKVEFNPVDFSDSKTLIWSSDDNGKVIELSNNVVKAIAPGTATVKAETVNGKTATITVTVPEIKAETLTLNKNVATLEKSDSEKLDAKILPENTTDELNITWSVDNEDIVTVDPNGVITAVAPGNAIVTAKAGNLEATCRVTVTSTLKSIVLDKNNVVLEAGETSEPLEVTLNPNDATVDSSELKWESLNTSVATINANGEITAIAPGTAIIRATLAGKTAECTVKVIVTLTGVEIAGDGNAIVYKNKTAKLNVELTPSNATEIPDTIIWTSSDESIASVDENGIVKGIEPGIAVITVDYGNNITASKTVEVIEVKSTGVTIVADGTQVDENESGEKVALLLKNTETEIEYVVSPEDTTDIAKWVSSDESVVKVIVPDEKARLGSKQVILKAVGAGKAQVAVKVGDYSDVLNVEVKEIPITSLEVSLEKEILEEEKTTKAIVVCKPENTTDEKVFEFKSSNESVATIDSNGVITAKKAGVTYITATAANGVTSSQVKLLVIEPVEKPENPSGPSNGGNVGATNPNQVVNSVVNGLTTSPHTGDMNILGLFILMIASLSGITIILKKK